MAQVVIDNPSPQFVYGGGSWSTNALSHYFGGSIAWPGFAQVFGSNADTGVYGELTFYFRGTSVAFVGNTPSVNASQWALFSIDGGPFSNVSFMDPSPPSCRQWYQSPTLSDTQHNITISHMPSVSIDYATVTAGQDTPLLGQVLIVDDDDPSITYKGNWSRNTNLFLSSYGPYIGLPYGNATHQTTTAGDSVTFRFTGTGITVAGIFSYDVLGTLSVNYTLDGVTSSQNYTVTPTTTEFTSGIKQQENFILFANQWLTAGNHTFELEITNCVNQVFELDYILYNPAFRTLATKTSLPSDQSSSTATSTATKKSSHVAAIVGGVVGSIVCLLVMLILLLYRRRFLHRHAFSKSMTTIGTPGPLSVAPFIISPNRTAVPEAGTPILGQMSAQISPAPASGSIWRNRLTKLVAELHQESTAAGGEEGNNPRVAEVRHRIAELVREGGERSGVGGSPLSPIGEMSRVAPPAYELD